MFDPSAPHIIILLVVVLLLFGSRRLPGAAKSLGQSMHIFKKSVQGLDEHGDPTQDSAVAATQVTPPPAALTAQPAASGAVNQQQFADLQRQIQDLQRQNAGADGAAVTSAPEAQRSQQPF